MELKDHRPKNLKMIRDILISLVAVILIDMISAILFGIDSLENITMLILLASLVNIIYRHSIQNYNIGYEFHIKKEYDLALDFYNKAIKLNPLFAAAYLNRGLIFAEKHEYDLAIYDYNKAIKLKYKHVNAYLNRGEAYIEQYKYDLAISDFDKVITFVPTDACAYFHKGHIYELQNRIQDAIVVYHVLMKNVFGDKESVEKAKERIRILGGDI